MYDEDGHEILLGRGGFGKVFLVEDRHSSAATPTKFPLYAMKVIHCASLVETNIALNEAQVLLEWKHPNIVKCHKLFLGKGGRGGGGNLSQFDVCIVMEYCTQGDLTAYMAAREKETAVGLTHLVL